MTPAVTISIPQQRPSLTEIHIPHLGNIAKDRLALGVVAAAATTLTALVALQVVAFTPLLVLITGVAFGVLAGMFVVFHFSRSAPVLHQVPAVPVLPQVPVVPVRPMGVEAAGGREAVAAAYNALGEFMNEHYRGMERIVSGRVIYDLMAPFSRVLDPNQQLGPRPLEDRPLPGVEGYRALEFLGQTEDAFVRVMRNHRRAIEAIVPQEAIRNIWGAFDAAKVNVRNGAFAMQADATRPTGVEAAGGLDAVRAANDAVVAFIRGNMDWLIYTVPGQVGYDLLDPLTVATGQELISREQEDGPLRGIGVIGGLESLGVMEDSFLDVLRDHAQAIRAIVPYPAIHAMWGAFDAATRAWRDNPQPIVEIEEDDDAIIA